MREIMTYVFIFSFRGVSGFLFVLLGNDMIMLQHICAVSACKHEPFDCTVVSFLSLQVVQPIRTLGLMVFPVLVMREHSPATFVWVLFWELKRVYLFENKICDSVMILMCLLFDLKWLWLVRLTVLLQSYTYQIFIVELLLICQRDENGFATN